MNSPKFLLDAWNLKAKKQLGQNFLVNPLTAETIVQRIGLTKNDCVIEIGPGLGALTKPLARVARKVWAIEKDPMMLQLLKKEIIKEEAGNVHLHLGDILKMNYEKVSGELGQLPIVVGNLPYNISSQVLIQLIQNRNLIDRAALMFQKELADRLMAPPGNRDYGRLSVMLNYCTTLKSIMRLNADQFFPKPKIDSIILDIKFMKPLPFPVDNEDYLFNVIKAAFGKRRKTLRNSLSQSDLGIDSNMASLALNFVGINPNSRAESLNIESFAALSRQLFQMRSSLI